MAEANAPKGGTKGLKRRVGPLSVGGWLLSLGGAGTLYLLFRRYEASRAAAGAAGGGTGAGVLTAGGTIPLSGSTSTTNSAPFTNYADWLQAAVSAISSGGGIDSGQALDGIQSWLGGGCVSQKVYNAITQSVISNSSIGLPPGWGTAIPSLSVCATPPKNPPPKNPPPNNPPPKTPAPNTSNRNAGLTGAMISAMTANGEHVISSYFDAANNTQYYLTNKGGVYNVGSGFYGSVFSLGAEFVGHPVSIVGNNMGGYTIINDAGQTYNFGPAGTGSDYATGAKGV